MRNNHMVRSAAYSGVLSAIVFAVSFVIPGAFPSLTATASELAAYGSAHGGALAASSWLTIPAVAFFLWFAAGYFEYLREPDDADRVLLQWGLASAVVFSALNLAGAALQAASVLRDAGASLPILYATDTVLFVVGMGAFAGFAFAAANEGRRSKRTPGWLNAIGYLVFVVDALFTLSLLAPASSPWSVTGYGAYVAPLLSILWVLVAGVVLIVRVPTSASRTL